MSNRYASVGIAQNMIGCQYGYTKHHLKEKTPSIPWNYGMVGKAFWSLRRLNCNWRIRDDRAQKNVLNRFKGKHSWLFMFGSIWNSISSAMWWEEWHKMYRQFTKTQILCMGIDRIKFARHPVEASGTVDISEMRQPRSLLVQISLD